MEDINPDIFKKFGKRELEFSSAFTKRAVLIQNRFPSNLLDWQIEVVKTLLVAVKTKEMKLFLKTRHTGLT